MSAMLSQITGVSNLHSTVCCCADQRKHESSSSLAFVREIHRSPVDSPHKGSLTRKMFPFDYVIMVTIPTIVLCMLSVCNLHKSCLWMNSLRWRHNGLDSVSNHQPHDCLHNHLFRRRSKKTSKLRVTGLCAGNSPGTGEFSAQMASNAENVSIPWRHHVMLSCYQNVLVYVSPVTKRPKLQTVQLWTNTILAYTRLHCIKALQHWRSPYLSHKRGRNKTCTCDQSPFPQRATRPKELWNMW